MLKLTFLGFVFAAVSYLLINSAGVMEKQNNLAWKEDDQRAVAKKDFENGNYRDALTVYLKLARDPKNGGETLTSDFGMIVNCHNQLQIVHELDAIREELLLVHSKDWRFLAAVAESYLGGEHWGFLTAGTFYRGQGRGGGQWTECTERDRTRALQLMVQAQNSLDAPAADKADFYLRFSAAVMSNRWHGDAWRLQELTDLAKLPDYEPAENGRWGGYRGGWGQSAKGAPVGEDGNPVFYTVPESWQVSKNDGQRWRWCLEQAAAANPDRRNECDYQFALFLHGQFGVQTMANWGIQLPRFDSGADVDGLGQHGDDPKANLFSLHTLKDNETIARLATGIKRFELPDEFNPIRIFQRLVERKSGFADASCESLAQIYEDRQQYPKAAIQWRQAIKDFGKTDGRRDRLAQIVDPWGRFENVVTQPAGVGATVEYRFRNGNSVTFTAKRIDFEALLQDSKAYLKSDPREFDWQKANFDTIGYDVLYADHSRYVKEVVANWTTELSPLEHHFDRRITITTPLQKAGAYLLTAKMKDGNESHIVIWIDDLAIMRKPVDGRFLYYIGDAITGAPIANANVEFFGWKMEWNQNRNRNVTKTMNFAEKTDQDGFLETDPKFFDREFQWLTIARAGNGRWAHLGFQNAWVNPYQNEGYGGTKVYGITDRPIYRPDQAVKFKFWLRETSYTKESTPIAAGKQMRFRISDPEGNEIFSQPVVIDDNGGASGEFRLGSEATLGSYALQITDDHSLGGYLSFRVEEYKKPEYEVTIEAPEKPIALGDSISAKIVAKYYFGGPVTNATVKYKVHRSPRDSRWFPIRRWDWLYGNGYWWYCSEYDWYPGFSRWGCYGPIMPWWGWHADPPELVLDEEAQIGPDGTVTVSIDTALAKALHGDQDHEYTITAEVVDNSRRTIVGSGSVIAARQPFRVYCWTDRGYYRVGEDIVANFSARTADGKGIAGQGKLQLLRITYDADGKPVESPVYSADLRVEESGEFNHKMKSSEPGQYRVSLVVDDGAGHAFEGGQVFVVMGQGFDGSAFRFNDLEVIADKPEYAPGDTMKLLIHTNRADSTVLLWLRPSNGNYGQRPKILKIKGKSAAVDVKIEQNDMPNFFIEATTIASAKLHNVARNVVVPPEKRVVDVTVEASQPKFTPGQEAKVKLKLTGPDGKPFVGSMVVTMYDRAIEYISGGSNVGDIREFFWKWTRGHHPQTESSLGRAFGNLYRPNVVPMQDLGVFGSSVADMDLDEANNAMRFKGGEMMAGGGGALGAPGAPAASRMNFAADGMAREAAAPAEDRGETQLAEPVVRKDFADAAYWNADVTTDADGTAEVSLKMPENLTDWKIRAWALGTGTRVGEGTTSVVTAKNIMVRLQAPRFFVEHDEVVLSAIVHNYLEVSKQVKVTIGLSGNVLEAMVPTEQSIEVPAGGDVRVDWRVKAIREGDATITMAALTDVESDAMQMTFPVFVHGILKTDSFSGMVRPDQDSGSLKFVVPAERKPEQSRLEIRYSPTLAGAMVDALPYLVDYPYGCTEQTLNRFLPTVMTHNILKRMNLDLASIRQKRTNLNAQEIGDDQERAKQWKHWAGNPVFDEAEVQRMVKKGVMDLTAMQNSDGGWGWFSGYGEMSWPHTTAVVVHGLQLARSNEVALVPDVLERGIAWLQQYQARQVALLKEGDRIAALPAEKRPSNVEFRTSADNLDALVYQVLIDADVANPEMADYLFRDRQKLSLYGMSLVGLAFDKQQDKPRRDMIIRNIDQFVVYDEENQTAYIDLPNRGNYWWYWYGDVIEANACYLKLLTRQDVNNPKAAGLVKYILNNRRHATYWNSTRDTALCIESLAEFLVASGEDQPNQTIEVWLDGELRQAVEITPAVLFQFDNSFILTGSDLTDGEHSLELRRKGKGPVYFNAYVSNFTLEDNITRAGLEVRVNRKFYKLVQREESKATVQGVKGEALAQRVEKYDRVELASLSEVNSGDLIEIELEIDSKNDYEYVIFEDLKAAGCEAVDLQSGYTSGGLGAYVQFRDEKVSFFMRSLTRGKHSVSYRLRAEIPGQFSALPAQAWAMYAPELKGNSDELKLRISETIQK